VIDSTNGYQTAVVADARRMLVRAVVDITPPDLVYGDVTGDSPDALSHPEQVYDKDFEAEKYATLELNLWGLDDDTDLYSDDMGEIGWVGAVLSDDDCTFPAPVAVSLAFSGADILQACSVVFPDATGMGYATDFTVALTQGDTVLYSRSFEGNEETTVKLDKFTVYDADAIVVTVTKWSLPGRRCRVIEIVPGIFEQWGGDDLASLFCKLQCDPTCLSMPYGTCTMGVDNEDARFDPLEKSGLFQSLEERQGIDVQVAARRADGVDEYKRVGMFYQYSGGWRTAERGLTLQWDLVDIIGLVSARTYIAPATLPTTLDGWVASVVAQLGENFATRYQVADGYGDLAAAPRLAEDIDGLTCGDILRYVCMATGTWAKADADTGWLWVGPLTSTGGSLTLDNMTKSPTVRANDDIAAVIFTLNDGASTKYVVSGGSTASSTTKSVTNPFIQTAAQADAAAAAIFASSGGEKLETTGRGDPARELGDVDTVELGRGNTALGRVTYLDLSFSGGVLQGCRTTLLRLDSEA
jgi:hypothetical protein